jgi:hypothetical protein
LGSWFGATPRCQEAGVFSPKMRQLHGKMLETTA